MWYRWCSIHTKVVVRVHSDYGFSHNHPFNGYNLDGGDSGAKVEMSGNNESTLVEQSSGIHLLEVNGANLGSNGGNKWSWMEILCIVLGFIFFLNLTHIAHYCLFTKKVVKRKVARDVQLELGKLAKAPSANETVTVPGLA